MGLIGHEIIQSRTYIDPTNPAPPNLNYKFAFPITVFDAVRRDMKNEDSETLTQVLDKIAQALKSKQTLIPAKPANYLMTYGGIAGATGSIQISTEIPWDEADQSHDRIPTEKAVGDLIRKIGLNPDDPDSGVNVRWSDIIAKPSIYNVLGNDDHGLISQKAITKILNNITSKMDTNDENHSNQINILQTKVDNHISDQNNPHQLTLNQLGAASAEAFNTHINTINPHAISAQTIGLGNVDNTSDIDKPLSKVAKEAIDRLTSLFDNMTAGVGELNFITNIKYNPDTGTLDLIYRDGSIIVLDSPFETSINDIKYDYDKKELIMTHISGDESRLNLSDLFIRYIGSTGTSISIEIDGNQLTGNQTIKATINPKSIKASDLADNSVVGRTIKDHAVTTNKIHDLCITTIKYADRSVTSEKIARFGVDNENIADRAVTGRNLFSSSENNRVLATVRADSNPIWTLVSGDMINYDAIQTRHLAKSAVTYDKIAPKSVDTSKIANTAITTEKIANDSVTTEKIKERNITSDLLAEDLILEGRPKLRNTPNDTADNNLITDTRWVRKFAKESLVVESSNIARRSVTGEKLFTSPVRNRVLAVTKANVDPEWTTISNEMLDIDSIHTINIIDKAITSDKLNDKAIESRHLNKESIQTTHIEDSAITSKKIYTSHEANRVLAALTKDGHPTYSQVTQEMLAPNSVDTLQLKDSSISLVKIQSSNVGQQVMTVGLSGSTPIWSKVMTQMINDRAVDGSKLFTSDQDNVILGLTKSGFNPSWIKVNGNMIADRTIKSINIGEKAIKGDVIDDNTIEGRSIKDNTITTKNIKDGGISPTKIESSPVADRVIAVTGLPYSKPIWSKVLTNMIEDQAVTREKIFQSKYPYHVLAATQAGVPPEYTMITHQFIVDGTIIPEKLKRDFSLIGTPELTVPPADDSDDHKLANTSWVRKFTNKRLMEFLRSEEVPSWFPKFDFNDIPDHGIDGSKLFTHPYGPRVLGITAPNSEVEFILIEENLIADGAVTTHKIQRNLHLLGSPEIEVRPTPNASDADGNGRQIPDCQWVLDRIAEATINGGDGENWEPENDTSTDIESGTEYPSYTGGTTLVPHGSITPLHLQNRAVTAEKLFTSGIANRLLGVTTPNSNPQYLQVNNEMIGDRVINGRTLFSSEYDERILATHVAGSDPVWTQVSAGMIGDSEIHNNHIKDRAISENKIETGAVSIRTLADGPLIDEDRLFDHVVSKEKIRDNAVTTEKIIDSGVTTSKIQDKAITTEKISDDIVLPENVTVKTSRTYEKSIVRNITISPKKPHGGRNGDIWFRFS